MGEGHEVRHNAIVALPWTEPQRPIARLPNGTPSLNFFTPHDGVHVPGVRRCYDGEPTDAAGSIQRSPGTSEKAWSADTRASIRRFRATAASMASKAPRRG